MKNAKALFFVAAATFASGFLSGLMFAPDSGRASRRRIAEKAQAQGRRLGEHIQSIEKQLCVLERDLQLLGRRLGDQLHSATQGHAGADDEMTWEVDPEEVTRELRGMPRK